MKVRRVRSPNTLAIGDRLRRLREHKRVAQADVALAVGVRTNQISLWERNRETPSLGNAVKLADYFGVTLDALAGRRN